MSRWPVLALLSMMFQLAGCASAVRPGLANAPRLGGSAVADERVHDVVSNGDEACGLHPERGVPPGRIPPCPSVVHPVATTWLMPSPAATDESLVLPWLEHFYAGWPCPRSEITTHSISWSTQVITACSAP